jgi:glycosyltransferase involved in cell wall biosynthesis
MKQGRRPAILCIAPAVPAAKGNGLAMRLGLVLEALHRVGEVDLIVLPLTGPPIPSALCGTLGIQPRFLATAGREDARFTQLSKIGDGGKRREAFAAYGRPTLTAGLSLPVLADLERAIDRRGYDLVHVSRSYLMPILALWPGPRPPPMISLDLDEDDVAACERQSALFRLRGNGDRADWEMLEARAFDRLHREWLRRVDVALISSRLESERIRARYPGTDPVVVPNAVEIPDRIAGPDDGRLLFVGGFGHVPNLDAALWLCEEIWPRLAKRLARPAKLTIVGRFPRPRLVEAAQQAGIELRPDVADLAPFYRSASLALAPLRAGGGTRLKLIEAAAWSVPSVSTSIGAEGLDFVDGRHLWIADRAEAFAAACADALERPDERRRRAAAALEMVRARHDRSKVIAALAETLSRRLDQASGRAPAARSEGAGPLPTPSDD